MFCSMFPKGILFATFDFTFTILQKLVTDKVSQITQQGEKHTPFLSHLKALPEADS